ncbi:aspartate aminotransferase family protein [Mesorhizobium sp. Z1-4]|uniref:aspartate aminotransferase family protein n=1 Tax=Mesorhizobium sp. Z1-4 TaxID=2448478 RepID=UPI000FD6C814|nr:aspartate aminotransferase family protein [Mesorhizobium sp. Z1-4]
MSFVLHRKFDDSLPTMVRGEGNYLIDSNGKRYFDACGGAAVSCLGHSENRVRDAIISQLGKAAFAHTGFFTNEPTERLAERLIKAAPPGTGNGRAMFLGSGSEAMEAALKLARQYHLERGQPSRGRTISRRSSYHGNTLGALSVGGHAGRRAPYAPLLTDCDHIDPCYDYRFRWEGETEEAFGLRMANQLAEKIAEVGADNVAAFVAEPIVGATLGSQPAASGYFRRIREICDETGVLFVADEVMCGSGRTGTLFALEQEGVHADLVTMAKGLGAGYQPIAAVIASQDVCDAIGRGSGQLWNGHTYMSHAVVCAGALAVLDVMEDDDLLSNVRETGRYLETQLRAVFGQHSHVGDIRGRGLFWSLELVQDRSTKTPFAKEDAVANRLKAAALSHGMLCYPAQGCADGNAGDHVLLAPPYAVTRAEVDLIVGRLGEALSDTLEAVA